MIKNLLFWVWLGLYFGLALPIVFIPTRFMRILGLEKMRLAYVQAMQKYYARILLIVGGARVHLHGMDKIPKERNLCIIANHQAYADILVVVSVIPFVASFIAKKELGQIPVLSFWMQEMGCLLIDRRNLRSGIDVIFKGIKMIKKHQPVLIFPEGTRSKGGKMGDFKKGSLKLATKSNAIIIPITLDGTYKFFEETGQVKSCDIHVTIHDPIPTQGLSPEQEDRLVERVHEVISSSLRTTAESS